jgi:hypothetical protein
MLACSPKKARAPEIASFVRAAAAISIQRHRHHKVYGWWEKRTQEFVEKVGGAKRGCPQGQAKEGRKQGEARLQSLK